MEIFHYSQPSTPDTQNSDYNEEIIQDNKKCFKCTFPECGKVFKFKSEITRHNVIHFDSRPFVCHYEDCRKTFKRADALDAHLQIHTKKTLFKCTFSGCGKKFTTKASLKYHVLKHNNDRSFQCSFSGCDKSFFTKGQLKQHQKASNYHENLAHLRVKEEHIDSFESRKKYHSDHYDDAHTETSSPLPHVKWETQDETMEEYTKVEDQHASLNYVVKYVLEENEVVEDQPYFFEGESNYSVQNTLWSEPINQPSVFFDDNELKILDFLKDQQRNRF